MPTPTRTLNDSHRIPALGYGTGTAFYAQSASEPVLMALRAGFTHVDAAASYENEASVGEALSAWVAGGGRRAQVWVTTKAPLDLGARDVREELKKSLEKLQTTYVDLYLLHTPDDIPDLSAAWKQMEDLKRDGLALSIGVSNFTLKQLQEVVKYATTTPSVNQIEFNPYLKEASAPLLAFMAERSITLEAYGPLTPLRVPGPLDAVLPSLAESLAITPGQLLLCWARSMGAVLLTTTSKAERAAEVLSIDSMPALSSAVVAQIDEAAKSFHYRAFSPHMDL